MNEPQLVIFAFCPDCMQPYGTAHKPECERAKRDLLTLPASEPSSLTAYHGDHSIINAIDATDSGAQWKFCGTADGPMMECVKIEPDGKITIAPHADAADLRNALLVLARCYYEATKIAGCIPRSLAIDVRV